MKKSELKEMIKSAMLDEAKKSIKEGEDVGLLSQEDIDMLESKNFNIQPIRAGANDPDPSGDLRFVAKWTLKDGTARANWPFLERLLLSKNIPFTDETWGGDGRSKKEWQVKSQYIEDNLSYPEHDFHGFNEAKDADVEDEDIDVDIEKDEEIDDKETDIEIETSMPGESESEEVIQGLLMKAQEEATKLGDEKLTDQIGNTITYFTRAHIARVDESGVNEEEDLSESIRFKKLAGIIK